MKGCGVEGVKGSSWVWFHIPTEPRTDFVKTNQFFI